MGVHGLIVISIRTILLLKALVDWVLALNRWLGPSYG